MITLEQYAMGRDLLFPEEWASAKPNAIILLDKVNELFSIVFPEMKIEVSSGFRPREINRLTPGASIHSLHITGKAIDINDADGSLKKIFRPLENQSDSDLLRKFGLFMEDPARTKRWIHLDMGIRVDRPSRVFKVS